MLHEKKMAIYFSAIFFAVLDRFLKSLAMESAGSPIHIIGEAFQFNFVKNYNIAFSIPLGGLFLNLAIAVIIISLTVLLVKSFIDDRAESFALAFIILGAASNYYDRLTYRFIIDYLDLKYFTVFNLADVMITAAGAILLVGLTKSRKRVII